jgi:hypothetical protein
MAVPANTELPGLVACVLVPPFAFGFSQNGDTALICAVDKCSRNCRRLLFEAAVAKDKSEHTLTVRGLCNFYDFFSTVF